MIPQDLLEMFRCPHCVTGETRRPGADPGRLAFVKEAWFVCQEPGCGRKYPVVDGIPDMRQIAGDRWIQTRVEALPMPPPKQG